MADNVRRIQSAPSAQAHAHQQDAQTRAEAEQREERVRRIAEDLRAAGSVVVACADDAERAQARADGRQAGRLLACSVRTKVLPDGRVGVWQPDRHNNPLQARLDEQRANRMLDESFRRRGPLTSGHPPEPGGS